MHVLVLFGMAVEWIFEGKKNTFWSHLALGSVYQPLNMEGKC